MSDEPNDSEEQLRLATSRTPVSDAALDAESAAAREAFLALGSAVEAAASNFDEAALIKRVTEVCVVKQACSTLVEKRNRNWRPLIATGAIAAGMLLAIAQIAMERQRYTTSTGSSAHVAKRANVETTRSATVTNALWNDPLDDEIALAAATIQQFSAATRGFDGSLLDMNDQLESLSRELSGETL